jgi:GNAT superfamily N-acetyltransferase
VLTYQVLSYKRVIDSAEEALTESLGQACRIVVKRKLDGESIHIIERIESKAFRTDLRYTAEEIASRGRTSDFFLLFVMRSYTPIAFLYGYRDPSDRSIFYLDTVATLVEGRGVGSTLIALALLHSLESGYDRATLRTEEQDEKGRRLRGFYQNLGFEVYPCDPSEGVGMRIRLDLRGVLTLFERAISRKVAPKSDVVPLVPVPLTYLLNRP